MTAYPVLSIPGKRIYEILVMFSLFSYKGYFFQPVSVFVVEDEAIVADDLRKTLVSPGYAVAGTVKREENAL
jgi:hypothetical protein